ncbi:MAG: hypothetical protein ACREJU_09575, partial [Nitrospiraceae bacterium]
MSLFFWNWNFSLSLRTIRVTPAMQAGSTNHVWRLKGTNGLEGGCKMPDPICECGNRMSSADMRKSDSTSSGVEQKFICQDHPFKEVWKPLGALKCPK